LRNANRRLRRNGGKLMMKSRREVLQAGAATLAAVSLARTGFAQNASATHSAATLPPAAPKFFLDAYSRNLQWCRTPVDLGKAVLDLGLHSVNLSVGSGDAHVKIDQVKSALPAFVKGLQQCGVAVRCVSLPITDADSANAEAALDAAASAGVGYYNWGGLEYESGKTMPAQIDGLKRRVAKLAKLNEKYRVKGLYQPSQGKVGSLFLDFLPVLEAFDPRYLGFRYDTAALLQPDQQNTALHLTLGAPYIGGVALNDARVTLDLPEWKQGPFEGRPEQLLAPSGGGDNTGKAGGHPLAYGGGGNPLPYRVQPVPTGTGMIDLVLVGKTAKDINFNGPAEVQVKYPLGGAESGAPQIALPRQEVIGRMKRDRITVEYAFAAPWGLHIVLPPFMQKSAPESGATQGEANSL
jgi:sugar phosphate isomerase/epimerase